MNHTQECAPTNIAEIMVYYARFDKISCIRKIDANDLQSAGEASGLVSEQRRLGRTAHQDQFLIGQHHHAGEGGKPHSQMNESLIHE